MNEFRTRHQAWALRQTRSQLLFPPPAHLDALANHTAEATPGHNGTSEAAQGAGAQDGAGAGWLPDWINAGLVEDIERIGLNLLWLVLFVVGGWLAGRLIRWAYDQTYRAEPTSGRLLFGKFLVVGATTVGASLALSVVYNVNPLNLFATLGILSLALGFGLQNTVANLAAGIGLTMDKPFDVGDRIEVGQTWGDVVSIGLRSTRILTTSGSHVVIPNAILDTQEVWNHTHHGNTHMRLEVPFGISYESSVPLAEALALKAARGHPAVLAYPEPVVRMRGFADNSVNLELRCWIDRATRKPAVVDRILRDIKDAFDEGGVAFPFPQRTISYLADLEHPAPTPDHLKGEAARKPVVVVCTRGRQAAQALSDTVVNFVAKLDARMLVLHVRPPQQAFHPGDGEAAVNLYMAKAQRQGVPASGTLEVGDFAPTLNRIAREAGAKLVVLGATHTSRVSLGWMRNEIQQIRDSCASPVVVLGASDENEALVEQWRAAMHPVEADANHAPDEVAPPDRPSVHEGDERPAPGSGPQRPEEPSPPGS